MSQEERVLTLEEQEKILMHAVGLIREPINWTTGHWKCAIDEKGMSLSEEDIAAGKQLKDSNGRPQFAYCIHGAVNEACLAVVGEDRAIQLGAVMRLDDGTLDYSAGAGNAGTCPVELLELDQLTWELHGDAAPDVAQDAMEFNDGGADHKNILDVLKTKLRRVRKEKKEQEEQLTIS